MKSNFESSTEALIKGLPKVVARICLEMEPQRQEFMKLHGITMQKYQGMNDTEKLSIDAQWRKFINW